MSIKESANKIINELADDASWDDLVKSLMVNKKITLGMTNAELAKEHLSEADLSAIIARLHGSRSIPDDMRNTKTYDPGNAATIGMVAGVVAIFFSFIFPPISWLGAIVAFVAGAYGMIKGQSKAWVPILMAMVSIVPLFFIINW